MIKLVLKELLPDIIEIRHQIHSNPELAFNEIATSALICETLKKFGYDVKTGYAKTGVSAVLDSGRPGKTVALRADFDALPIQEQSNLNYRSKNNGVMHACGHDGHTATLLAVAGSLIKCKEIFKGKIKFIFQPAEETGAGAAAMIKDGILENPKVDAIFGYHNTFRSELGELKTKFGCLMAGQDAFTITIKGKGGHAAHLENIIDPIYIGSTIVQALQSIVSRSTPSTECVVISVTQFHSGTTYNAMPDEAMLSGTIRTVTLQSQKKVKEHVESIAKNIATSLGGTATIVFDKHFPPTINHENETKFVFDIAKKILGDNKVECFVDPSMASEDFSHYLEKIPGCFFFMGNGNNGAIHSATYQFNDDLIAISAEMMARIAVEYLNGVS